MHRQQESMIGNSAALALALDRASQLAPINRPVIILGDRGTGKELIAARLHFLSNPEKDSASMPCCQSKKAGECMSTDDCGAVGGESKKSRQDGALGCAYQDNHVQCCVEADKPIPELCEKEFTKGYERNMCTKTYYRVKKALDNGEGCACDDANNGANK